MLGRGERLLQTGCGQAINVGPRIARAGHFAVTSSVGRGMSLRWRGVTGATISRVGRGAIFAGVEQDISLQGCCVEARVETTGV